MKKNNINSNQIYGEIQNCVTRKVLVLGNGFDLAHGLLTDYGDFLRIIKEPEVFLKYYNREIGNPSVGVFDEKNQWKRYLEYIKDSDETEIKKMVTILKANSWAQYYAKCNAEIEGWVDFEREMFPVIKMFNSIISSGSKNIGSRDNACSLIRLSDIGIERIARIWPKYIQDVRECGGSLQGIYVTLQTEYSDNQYGVITKKLLSDVSTELDEFVEAFCIYLRKIVESKHDIKSIGLFENISVSDIVSFNYTDTSDYYESLRNATIHHVHGSTINKGSEKMIFGVNKVKDDAEYEFKNFEKRFQRLCNSEKQTYKSIIEEGSYELVIFGHSLDITDKAILEPLINGANNSTVYCYKNADGYSDRNIKIKNLMLLLGDEAAEEMLYNEKIVLKELDFQNT